MCRTRTCATSLIPSGRHGTARCCFSGFAAFGDGRRDGFVAGRECATFFTFVGAAGRACDPCFFTVAGACLAARSPEPPAQPAARIGTRIHLAARAVTNGYPVNFGSAFVGVAAGAVPPPPPPPPLSVVVVSVDVVSF